MNREVSQGTGGMRLSRRRLRWWTATAALWAGVAAGCTPWVSAHTLKQTVKHDAAPAKGAFATGQYPNLFAQIGKSPQQIQAKINAAWQQLFHGDPNNETVYYPFKNGTAYIYDTGNQDVRTEGIGYGMMIAVQLNHKKEFDALWKFAKTYMQNKDGPEKGYFAWHTDNQGNVLDPGPAPDGDSWIATALLFAAGRWGNGTGIYNYTAQAQQILHAMLHQTDNGGINMFDATAHLPVFAPSGNAATFTDPSYNLPAFYRIWALADKQDAAFWNQAARASEAFFHKAVNPKTGLTPDYATFDGIPTGPEDHTNFEYDAWRTIANAAVDYTWFAADPWQRTYANTLESFFLRQGIDTYVSLYTVDGKPLGQYHSTGLVAMNAASALAATLPNRLKFVQALWNAPIPTGQYRYYDGMLYMLGLLYCSGEFKAWGYGHGLTGHVK
ncbi:hypothetical protein GCM10010885_10540 [Alicyclobacillus cellulosilyticus]|uniref:Oligosaccharide reducing-end xylanase n=1 Tax=Alicyclobacillus cellulosilyticus TaxID=1003997 RepID=A0A917K6U0_9BACL|nr:glycosyl hydrolase family 8 [Alicyclobacillus cellulosilyticus]GGJ03143.1 hypothetical protein GCM10010885_10540 [Alicyclobacillus cellulosilyticus]